MTKRPPKTLIWLAAALLAGCAATPQTTGTDAQPTDEHAAGASECGEASHYADALAGNATASGEPYDPQDFTAAHKTLPFGAELRVVRRDTGAETEVRINDRGPFTPGRIVDVSRAAAAELDLITAGVAEVCIYVK